ncbi:MULTISPECIES: hypothetical protein [Capnocytophaga]|jgi:putative membrane protein|uniref:Uncharacterized protein n=3 Tax=Capnocytophaga TaxID=1016 RepID=A0A1Z4BN82_9FLAO|nr:MULTISPECIES: hypothetical protein [Capnocytophaga]ASF42761.1 hypothetical protein CBG49_06555 [Capnocytophaga endodontalis]EKY14230.1 hypothetical protein HMPREF9073_02273 [Capnocytophaga sp. oral taxon 326 str. F0382]MBI1647766.1 hypothetical protein [Capnocytophaga periodontitidis]MBI1669561.1 hypothetical protein [Capnocytophaga periodontitidis]MBM0651347.1 hypothetical protein [Capnocytophaga genosp. AHN8471]
MYKIAKYVALALGVIGVILWGVLSSTNAEDPNNGAMQALFVLTYILLAIAFVAVVISAAQNILSSPKALKKTLIYTGGFVVILLVAYIFSSGAVEANASEEVKKASESVRKWTSTGLIALYILVAAAVVALIASNVKKALMR